VTKGAMNFPSVMLKPLRFPYAFICLFLFAFAFLGCSSGNSSENYSSGRMEKADRDSEDFPRTMESAIAASSIPQAPDFAPQPSLSDLEPIQNVQQKGTAAQLFNDGNRSETSIPKEGSFLETTQDERIVVANATLTVTVADLNQTLSRLTEIILGSGGWVVSSDTRGATGAVMVARVPAGDLPGIVTAFKEGVIEVNSESLDSRDVTKEYIDNTSKLSSLEATQKALLALMGKTEKVEEILEVRRELADVQSELEVLKGEIQYLEESSAYSLITANILVKPSSMNVDAGDDLSTSIGGIARFRAVFESPETVEGYSFYWDFGDGSPLIYGDRTAPTAEDDTRVTSTVSHSYWDDRDSPYIAKIVLNGHGHSRTFEGEDTLTVSVSRMPVIEVFAGEYLEVNAGENIDFQGSFTRSPLIEEIRFSWDFGDGTLVEDVIVEGSGTRALANHKYVDARPFPYRARLTVTGQTDSGTIEGVGEVSVYVSEPKGWMVRGWDMGESSKTAVRALTGAGYVLLSAIIWALVFSPIWLGVLVGSFFIYRFIRKKKKSGNSI
ncbi:uncharacterized protein METZ01_LOCUS47088, partial [marine metagenome]